MESPINPQAKIQGQQSKNDKPQQKNQNQDQLKKQVSRRSRKDIQGRDFVCGCGKKYLSYPALYTHIKTKHDGRQPEGTMKYSTAAPAKKTKTKLEQQHLAQMYSLVKRQDIRLLDVVGERFNGSTSLSARLKSKILQKQITDTYHALLKNTTSPLRLNKQNPLQQHLVAFLLGVGQFVTEKLHQQYQWFARTVKECYYQMGSQVYNKCFSKKQGGLCYVPNFKVQKVKYFPLICDFYIRFFLPYEYSQLNSNLMELILTDFCNWLNKRKCTFIQIVLNKQYKLLAPLQFEQEIKPQSKNQNDLKNQYSQHDKSQQSHRSDIQDQESIANQNHKESQSLINGENLKNIHLEQNDIVAKQNNLDSQIVGKSQSNDMNHQNGYENIKQERINGENGQNVEINEENKEEGQKSIKNEPVNPQVDDRIITENEQNKVIQDLNIQKMSIVSNNAQNNSIQKMSKHWSIQVQAPQQSSQSVPAVQNRQQKNQSEQIPLQNEEVKKNAQFDALSKNI